MGTGCVRSSWPIDWYRQRHFYYWVDPECNSCITIIDADNVSVVNSIWKSFLHTIKTALEAICISLRIKLHWHTIAMEVLRQMSSSILFHTFSIFFYSFFNLKRYIDEIYILFLTKRDRMLILYMYIEKFGIKKE